MMLTNTGENDLTWKDTIAQLVEGAHFISGCDYY